MSEEQLTINNNENSEKAPLSVGYKSLCTRLGLVLIAIFGFRLLAEGLGIWLGSMNVLDSLTSFQEQLLDAGVNTVFLYLLPMTATLFLLKNPVKNSSNKVYSKPKYAGKALAMLPAGYGCAIAVRLVTLLLSMLFENTPIKDAFDVVQKAIPATPDVPTALVLFVQLVVIAPIFEEYWFRGMIMESLRPYGNGVAIFISAIMFGLTHGNFEQFFYATAFGIFLGYIAISTQSIVTTTIMHAIFNSISAFMILLSATPSVQDYVLSAKKDTEAPITFMVVLYFIWMAVVMLLLVVGIIMMVFKFTKIKKYKVPVVQTELSAGKRWGIYFSRISVIVGLVLASVCFMLPAVVGYLKLKEGV